MPRGAKLSLAANVPNQVALHSNSNTTSKVHHKWKENIDIAKQLVENPKG
jgi:hypothetical protein